MFLRKADFVVVAAACGAMMLSSCSTQATLSTKNAIAPTGVDLSGRWLVRADPGAAGSSMTGDGHVSGIPSARKRRHHRATDSDGETALIFLEYGTSLKITQTPGGLFISYDRSVVEEYRFGENRMIHIGPIEAQRASGWDDTSFVVETLDDSGTTLFEAWHLEDNGNLLVRDIRLYKGDKDRMVRRQLYDRL